MSHSDTNTSALPVALNQVVSGGQTGVDRAGLDAALAAGVSIGGWCPRNRRAEDGRIPDCYPLSETAGRSYSIRTEWNIRDSDGTLIVVLDEFGSGTKLTLDMAKRMGKPWQVVHLSPSVGDTLYSDENPIEEQLDSVVRWLSHHRIRVLNVAGPRGSSHSEVYPKAKQFLSKLLRRVTGTVS